MKFHLKGGCTLMLILLAAILPGICQSCATQNTGKMKEQSVNVTGVAQNGKSGALVKTLEGEIYYIEGLSFWPADLENRQVDITGNLKVATVSEEKLKNEQGEWIQGIAGKINTIQRAQWKISVNTDR